MDMDYCNPENRVQWICDGEAWTHEALKGAVGGECYAHTRCAEIE